MVVIGEGPGEEWEEGSDYLMGREFWSCKRKRVLGGDGPWQWLYNLTSQSSVLQSGYIGKFQGPACSATI